jgi:CheY-like chemotaxis protein
MYNRNLLVNMLQNLNYKRIDTAENGEIALSMIIQADKEGDPYDILLLDLRMPIMTGYNTMLGLKEINITQPNIVIVTASVMDEDKQKCRNLGAKYFITKPIEMQQLKNVMLHLSDLEI